MKLFSHNQSKKIYEILTTTEAEVVYRAVGNGGARFRLTPAVFGRKFTALTRDQAELVDQFRIEIETLDTTRPGVGDISTTFLSKLATIIAGAESDAKLEELWHNCDSGPGELIRPSHDFNRIALDSTVMGEVRAVVVSIQRRHEIDADFQLAEICPIRRSVYCFYGPPGTGKTITIHAVAKELGRLLYQVDYSEVNSSHGRKEIFRRARQYNAVLFLDEADSLCAARTFWPSATAQRLNTDKNVFIQTLDKYDGPILMSTNLLNHFDEALMRRTSRHIRLSLPDAVLRTRLFQLHLPNLLQKVAVDHDRAATASDGLSGGDIQNVCFNAIDAACIDGAVRANWRVTTEHIIHEIEKVNQAKRDNLVGNQAAKRAGRATIETTGGEE